MSFKWKCVVAALLVCLFTVGTVAYAATETAIADNNDETTAEGTYQVTVDGATMTVDKKTLNLSVTKNGRTWYSGKRYSEEDGLNALWQGRLQDAVTIGYRALKSNNTLVNSMTRLKALVSFTEKPDGFDAKINCRNIKLLFTLQVRLTASGITATVPFDSIQENDENYRLQYMQIYPFFDSSYGLVDGTILLPDGSGATVDLSVSTKAKQPYSARIFGADYGITPTPVSSTAAYTASMPILALMYKDGGTMVTADKGAEYCEINAYVSTIQTNYNLAFLSWVYRETYTKFFQSAGTDGKSYVAFQTDKNQFDLVQTMTFLDADCGVADVAKEYGKKVEIKNNPSVGNAGLRLSFLMSENKQGMFGTEIVNMTTTSFVEQVAWETSAFCDNLNISVYGYTKGGLQNSYPNHFPLDGKSGGRNGYSELSETLSSIGAKFAMTADFVKAYEDASIKTKNLALNMSNQFITVNDNRTGSSAKFNLVNADYAAAALKQSVADFSKYTSNLDLSSIGYLLYSGYENSFFTRSDATKIFADALKDAGIGVNLERPNSYLWSVCNAYLETPISSSNYLIETQSVPFLQMVLSGKVEMYSMPFNLNFTGREYILRLIDYNVYPSFTLTEQDSIDLFGTNSSGVFTSQYDMWKGTVQSVYAEVNGVLGKVAGETVTDRITVENGVYATVYSNGVTVVVNYSSTPVEYKGVTVAGQSAAAVK